MNTPPLPPNHEPVTADFLRQHGCPKGALFFECGKWTAPPPYAPKAQLTEQELKLPWCAPLGTIAAATTPVPVGRCKGYSECAGFGYHHTDCPANPRNAYVPILPHLLAQLPEKPEGLKLAHPQNGIWENYVMGWPFEYVEGYAYAVRRHVIDRIEQQLSTKGDFAQPHGGETMPGEGNKTPEMSATERSCVPRPEAQPTTETSLATGLCNVSAAPASSDPTGEAATIFYERVAWWVQHNAPDDNWWKVTLEQFRPAAMKEDGK